MKIRNCLLLFVLATAFTVRAQSSLGIDSAALSYSYNPSTYFNQTDLYRVTVINFGPQTYSASYVVTYAVDSSGTGNGPLAVVDTNVVSNATLVPGSAGIPDSAYIFISPLAYRSGINTVVIWPRTAAGSNATTFDSLKVNVLVLGYAGIVEPIVLKPSLYPNPTRQDLYIAAHNFEIERVIIYGQSGNAVLNEKFTGKINVSALSTGTYILVLNATDGRVRKYSFVKE